MNGKENRKWRHRAYRRTLGSTTRRRYAFWCASFAPTSLGECRLSESSRVMSATAERLMLSLPKAPILARSVSHDFCCSMNGKPIYQTEAVRAFADAMSDASRRKYNAALYLLAEDGVLTYPRAEKVEGHRNLFEIRILTKDNERFFDMMRAQPFTWFMRSRKGRARRHSER